jgi:hypothetical protein
MGKTFCPSSIIVKVKDGEEVYRVKVKTVETLVLIKVLRRCTFIRQGAKTRRPGDHAYREHLVLLLPSGPDKV